MGIENKKLHSENLIRLSKLMGYQEKVNFRFVLAMILMRKRRLKYNATINEDGKEVWHLRVVGEGVFADVVNPHLDEEQIDQLSSQIGQILHADL